MREYDPEIPPPATAWLRLDEWTRIDLIQMYHEEAGADPGEGGHRLHALMHQVVENQIAMRVEGVNEAMSRLIGRGQSRHEALHAVAVVLCEDLFNLMKGTESTFDAAGYKARLDQLGV